MVPASSLASPCSSGGGSLSPQGAALSRVEVAMQASLRQGPAPIKDAAVVPKCVAGSSAAAMWAVLTKFQNNWMLYCTIPVVAGLLNWATNKLAVQMIFYPLNFWGLKIKTWPETPLGLIGWTGIVPAKARTMAQRMVRMVTSSLIDVREVARRLQPAAVAALLQPLLPAAIEKAAHEGGVGWVASSGLTAGWTQRLAGEFVTSFTVKMQDNIQDIMDLEHLVVTKMVQEKKLLVELFQTCGKVELAFVVRSGLYLGFLLGLVQMGVWVCWDPWWSLAVGGAAVGYVTNFIAIKSIFEPVEPVKVGGWKLQGLFLTRQHEVAAEFARFLTGKVLTPDDIWREILYGERRERFEALLEQHIRDFAGDFASKNVLGRAAPSGKALEAVVRDNVLAFIQEHHPKVHGHMDQGLDLETTMRDKMRAMSPQEFEGVLHPIFEEDELTLILTGATLGLLVGFLQSLAPY